MITKADTVWNRAVLENGGENALPGDVALSDLLLAHGMIMNGGVFHVYEALTDEELVAAVAGYRYFALEVVAKLIEDHKPYAAMMDKDDLDDSAVEHIESVFEKADAEYAEALPDDGLLVTLFEQVYERRPAEFADI